MCKSNVGRGMQVGEKRVQKEQVLRLEVPLTGIKIWRAVALLMSSHAWDVGFMEKPC